MKNQKRKCGRRWKKTVCRLTQKQHIQSDDFKNEFCSIQIRALNAVPFLLTESQSHGSCTISTQSLFTLFVQLLISKRYGNFVVFVSFFLFYFFNAAILWLRPLDLVRFDFYSYRYRHIVWFMSCVHWFACIHIFSSFRTVIFVFHWMTVDVFHICWRGTPSSKFSA